MSRPVLRSFFAAALAVFLVLPAKLARAHEISFDPGQGGHGPSLVVKSTNAKHGSEVTLTCGLSQQGDHYVRGPAADAFLSKFPNKDYNRLFEDKGQLVFVEVKDDRSDPRDPPRRVFKVQDEFHINPQNQISMTECYLDPSAMASPMNCSARWPTRPTKQIKALWEDLHGRCAKAYDAWLKAGAPKTGKIKIDLAP